MNSTADPLPVNVVVVRLFAALMLITIISLVNAGAAVNVSVEPEIP